MAFTILWSLVVFIAIEKLIELGLARRNRIKALTAGGKEYGSRHYRVIIVLYMLWFVSLILESLIRGPALHSLWSLWFTLFILAELLRYWAIYHLGSLWNTRIIVIPNTKRVTSGPFRFVTHPIYLAVTIEVISVPLILNAWITTIMGAIGAAIMLLAVRIPIENRALKELR